MTNTRLFALVCWTLWIGLLFAGSSGLMPAPLATVLAVSIFFLWRLLRREILQAATARLR
jgi:hypothetical protein